MNIDPTQLAALLSDVHRHLEADLRMLVSSEAISGTCIVDDPRARAEMRELGTLIAKVASYRMLLGAVIG